MLDRHASIMTVGTKLSWLLREKWYKNNAQEKSQKTDEKSEDEFEAMCQSHHVPTDILSLRDVSSESGEVEVGVFSTMVLRKESSFGPFKASIIEEEERNEARCVIEVYHENEKVLVAVTSEEGHWLKLIRTSVKEASTANVCICLQKATSNEGLTIWCEIISDIMEETELVGICGPKQNSSIQITPIETEDIKMEDAVQTKMEVISPKLPSPNPDSIAELTAPELLASTIAAAEVAMVTDPMLPPRQISPPLPSNSPTPSPPRFPLIYGCVHCGVKFSNPDTLEAHLMFYCAKKPRAPDLLVPTDSAPSTPGKHNSPPLLTAVSPKSPADSILSGNLTPGVTASHPGSAHGSPRAVEYGSRIRPASDEEDNMLEAPSPKVAKTGASFQCPMCSYTADKKVSLVRHLRMHSPATERLQAGSPEEENFPVGEMRCEACNIQFTSFKTFIGHKEYYCAMRHRNSTPNKSVQHTSPPSTSQSSRAQSAGSPTHQSPVAAANSASLLPGLLAPGASHMLGMSNLAGQAAAMVLATPVMAPGGVGNMAFNIPTVIMQPVLMPNMFQAHQNPSISTGKAGEPSASAVREEQPLDLTTSTKRDIKKPIHSPPISKPKVEAKCKVGEAGEPQDLSVKKSPKSPGSSSGRPATATPPSEGSHRGTPKSHQSEPSSSTNQSAALVQMTQQPMGIIPQGPMMMNAPIISKCHECNIVFYKHENFMIHKEHYCASRRGKRPAKESPPTTPNMGNGQSPHRQSEENKASLSSPASPRGKEMVAAYPAGMINPAEMLALDQAFLQFYCLPCKIKFSSMDTLKAHQQFYCPSRSELPPHPNHPAASPTKSRPDSHGELSTPEGDMEEGRVYTCPNCDNSYPSMRLLKLHFCKASSMQVPLLRCPYCEYITQSDARLVEHIKAHAPTKAYKCTICGYRGNTVRGMRMHGKLHIDAGEEFTDENMLEFEEPPLIPKRLRTLMTDNSPVDLEAELIRLKNEPYKRRRSRKLYERHDSTPPLRRQAPHMCVTCNEVFPDTTKLRLHMRVHFEETTFACRSCDFNVSNKASLVRHVKMIHENGVRSSTEENMDAENNENIDFSGISTSSPKPVISNDAADSVKKEPLTEGYPENEQKSLICDSDKSMDRVEKINGIKDSEKISSIEHSLVKIEKRDENINSIKDITKIGKVSQEASFKNSGEADHVNTNGEVRVSEEMNIFNKIEINGNLNKGKKESKDQISPQGQIQNGLIRMTRSPSCIKQELLENYKSSEVHEIIPHSPQKMEPVAQSPDSLDISNRSSPGDGNKLASLTAEELILAKKNDKSSPQYCKQCDITFMYVASFMAHKKYYCSSHAGEKTAAQTEV